MECLFDIGHTNGRHLFLITFINVFQLVAKRKRVLIDTAIIQPLLTCKRVKEHFNRHQVAHLHRLIELAIGKCGIVFPVTINAVVNAKRNGNIAPVHIKRVEFKFILANIKTEFHSRIFGEIVHKRSLQIREFIIQIQIQEANRIAQVKNVADVSCTTCKHPTRWTFMAFGMELCCKRTDFDTRLAKPFFDRILATRATFHFEHRA